MSNLSRRQFARGAVGLAIGAFAAGRYAAAAQEATPGTALASPSAAVTPLGYVSLRVRALKAANLVPEIDKIVVSQFVPTVRALPGYEGYILGDIIEQPNQNLAVTILQSEADNSAFNAAAQLFIAGLNPKYVPTTPRTAVGDLFIAAAPAAGAGTPVAATPGTAAPALRSGYIAARLYTSKPGTNPLDTVPIGISGFLPIVRGITGFKGYLWFANAGGFGALSLFDSPRDAAASTAAAKDWVAKNVAGYVSGSPVVINAKLVYADLPVLASHGA